MVLQLYAKNLVTKYLNSHVNLEHPSNNFYVYEPEDGSYKTQSSRTDPEFVDIKISWDHYDYD